MVCADNSHLPSCSINSWLTFKEPLGVTMRYVFEQEAVDVYTLVICDI